MLSYRQIPSAAWPNGDARPLAVLAEEPPELTQLIFEPTVDDLGEAVIAVIETDSGFQFGLLRYRDSPVPGTAVYIVGADESMPQALASLEEVLVTARERFRWVSPIANVVL